MPSPITPNDVLSDDANSAGFGDVTARKGSIAAFVANAKLLEGLADDSPDRDPIIAQLRVLAPALLAVGVLDVFKPRSPLIAAIFADHP